RGKYGVGAVIFANGIGYRTDTGKPHPTNWAQFWDTTTFPGPRGLYVATYGTFCWEPALLADGVDPSKLYPLDYNRAQQSLNKIKPSVHLWISSTATGVQALVSGDVTYSVEPNGRIAAAKAQGAKVDFDYGQALISADFWV